MQVFWANGFALTNSCNLPLFTLYSSLSLFRIQPTKSSPTLFINRPLPFSSSLTLLHFTFLFSRLLSSTINHIPQSLQNQKTTPYCTFSRWILLKDPVSWLRTMVWLPLQIWKLGILGIIIIIIITITIIINMALYLGLWVMPLLSIEPVSEAFPFLPRDLGDSMMPDLKISNPISLTPVFSARSHLRMIWTSSCTGQRLGLF